MLREACPPHPTKPSTRTQFVVAAAPERQRHFPGRHAPPGTGPPEISLRVVADQTYDALAASDAAIVSSGTATVETALLDVPMVVVYRVTPLTALLAKPLVRTPFFSMVNLIAEKRAVPELIQSDFTPDRVAKKCSACFATHAPRQHARRPTEVRRRLGPPGAVDRAADRHPQSHPSNQLTVTRQLGAAPSAFRVY